jgi:cytochrome c peroxidase
MALCFARRVAAPLLTLFASATALACHTEDDSARVAAALANSAAQSGPKVEALGEFNPRLLRRFLPARETIASGEGEPSEPLIELGRMLYHEKRLSKSQELSCNNCHQLERYGVDAQKTSPGHRGQRGERNSPTVYHAAANFEQFWDGRALNVETQALAPILNPVEMAAPSQEYVVNVLESMPEYVAAFDNAFPGQQKPLTFSNVGNAIGAFERKLTTRSRWDKYLEGDRAALTQHEVQGLKLFTNLGCMVCHTGELLGGSMYEKVGAVEPWPNQRDQGRFSVTQREGDRMMFKVPTLRNVSETAPYFHDGFSDNLEHAVTMMGRHQLGLELETAEVGAIVVWLRSLKGDLPARYVARPELPKSTERTPRPDQS